MAITFSCPNYNADYYGKPEQYKAAVDDFRTYLTGLKEKLLKIPGVAESIGGARRPTPLEKNAAYFEDLAKKEVNRDDPSREELENTRSHSLALYFSSIPSLLEHIDTMLSLNPVKNESDRNRYEDEWKAVRSDINYLTGTEVINSVKDDMYRLLDNDSIGYGYISEEGFEAAAALSSGIDEISSFSGVYSVRSKIDRILADFSEFSDQAKKLKKDEIELKARMEADNFSSFDELKSKRDSLAEHKEVLEETLIRLSSSKDEWDSIQESAQASLAAAKTELAVIRGDEAQLLNDLEQKRTTYTFFKEHYQKGLDAVIDRKKEIDEELTSLSNNLRELELKKEQYTANKKQLSSKETQISKYKSSHNIGDIVEKRKALNSDLEQISHALNIMDSSPEERNPETCDELFGLLRSVYKGNAHETQNLEMLIRLYSALIVREDQAVPDADGNIPLDKSSDVVRIFSDVYRGKLKALADEKSIQKLNIPMEGNNGILLNDYDKLMAEKEKLEDEKKEISLSDTRIKETQNRIDALMLEKESLAEKFYAFTNDIRKGAGLPLIDKVNKYGMMDPDALEKEIRSSVDDSELQLGKYVIEHESRKKELESMYDEAEKRVNEYDAQNFEQRIRKLNIGIEAADADLKNVNNLIRNYVSVKQDYNTVAENQKNILKLISDDLKFPGGSQITRVLDSFEKTFDKGYDGKHQNTDEYSDMINAMTNAVNKFHDPDRTMEDRITAIRGLQEMTQTYLDKKHAQFRPFASDMRKARLRFAEDLLKFTGNALHNMEHDIPELKGMQLLMDVRKQGQTFIPDISDDVFTQKLDAVKTQFPKEYQDKIRSIKNSGRQEPARRSDQAELSNSSIMSFS